MNILSAVRIALGTISILLYATTWSADWLPKEWSTRTALFQPFIGYIQEGNLSAAKHYKSSRIFSKFINWTDKEGRTPLRHAVDGGHDYMVSFLLEHKADPTIADNKAITPLQIAQDKKLEKIIALLQSQK